MNQSKRCQWPEGDPTKPDFRFCGAKAVEGQPYCDDHCKRAYVGWGEPGHRPIAPHGIKPQRLFRLPF